MRTVDNNVCLFSVDIKLTSKNMHMFTLDNLLRENIKKLVRIPPPGTNLKEKQRYSLDAMKTSLGSPLTTAYKLSDPLQTKVKNKLAEVKGFLSGIYSWAMAAMSASIFYSVLAVAFR